MKVISRSQPLALTSDVFTTKCTTTGIIKSTNNLEYTWRIYEGTSNDDAVTTIKNNALVPNAYKLKPFSLKSGYYYYYYY